MKTNKSTILIFILLVNISIYPSFKNKSRVESPTNLSKKNVVDSIIKVSNFDLKYIHHSREISIKESILTAMAIQCVYAGGYSITQYDNIRKNGSFKNWYTNISKIHFDKDSYDYNIIIHVGNAHFSYLFYRSMGYKKLNSFAMTFIGSTVFEFLIETITEPPSLQDLWQTPALGTLLGMVNESIALYLINSDYKIAQVISYIFNPFMLLNNSHYNITPIPILKNNYQGLSLAIRF